MDARGESSIGVRCCSVPREVDLSESEDLIHDLWSCFPEMDASGNSGWRAFQYTDMRTWYARSHRKEL
ncbi:hypothetical protein M404DRAFT_1000178 [Pisolithus tinctorius Marx 270]|uniref:Uncharacterized protein n=1 Tax=Pisolithus tinctorius Marx 270 TaxID=870435 RepID=A0A0C3NWD7_PISTI|nr:hypothetical protein M404DRAFT_1000178 [Pisolithus tinctorius Marx 270]